MASTCASSVTSQAMPTARPPRLTTTRRTAGVVATTSTQTTWPPRRPAPGRSAADLGLVPVTMGSCRRASRARSSADAAEKPERAAIRAPASEISMMMQAKTRLPRTSAGRCSRAAGSTGAVLMVASRAKLPMLRARPHEGDHGGGRHRRRIRAARCAVGRPPRGAGDREASSSSPPSWRSPLLRICTPSGIPAITPR